MYAETVARINGKKESLRVTFDGEVFPFHQVLEVNTIESVEIQIKFGVFDYMSEEQIEENDAEIRSSLERKWMEVSCG